MLWRAIRQTVGRRRAIRRSSEEVMLELDGLNVTYQLKRSSARRTLAMRVGEAGKLVVNAPLSLPPERIESFLRQHADWLHGHLSARPPGHVWSDGVELPYLGGALALAWTEALGQTHATCQLEDQSLRVEVSAERLPAVVEAWYRQAALALFAERLAFYSARMGVPVPPLRLSNARTRWGSLSPKGVVSLNWRLIKARPAIIDYVICHELAHLRQRNHSATFWREVARLYPDHAAARSHLRQAGRSYFDF